jgi:hypothetical protein
MNTSNSTPSSHDFVALSTPERNSTGPTHEAERHRHRQHRRGREEQVAAEVAERLLDA